MAVVINEMTVEPQPAQPAAPAKKSDAGGGDKMTPAMERELEKSSRRHRERSLRLKVF
jgi:hypothetical protein